MKKSVKDIIKDLRQVLEFGIVSPVVVMSEHQPFTPQDVANEIEKQLGVESRSCTLGYIQRGGAPSVKDKILAIKWGIESVEMLLDGKYGYALGVKGNRIISVPIEEANRTKQIFDMDSYRALRKLYNLK